VADAGRSLYCLFGIANAPLAFVHAFAAEAQSLANNKDFGGVRMRYLRSLSLTQVLTIAIAWAILILVLTWRPMISAAWRAPSAAANGDGGIAVIGVGYSPAFIACLALPVVALLGAWWYARR